MTLTKNDLSRERRFFAGDFDSEDCTYIFIQSLACGNGCLSRVRANFLTYNNKEATFLASGEG
jgi:hypothetical protein